MHILSNFSTLLFLFFVVFKSSYPSETVSIIVLVWEWGRSHTQAWRAATHGVAKSDTTEQLNSMINDVKHFMDLLAVCMSLEKYLFQVLCPFFNWIICFCWVGVLCLFWVLTYQKLSASILSPHVVISSFFVLWVLNFYVIFLLLLKPRNL